jgi:hypothetical protein
VTDNSFNFCNFNKNCNIYLRDNLHSGSRLFIWYHFRAGLPTQHSNRNSSHSTQEYGKMVYASQLLHTIGRKWFLFVVSLSHYKLWTVLLVSRGKQGVSCYSIEDCYDSNSIGVRNGPQTISRTCDCLRRYGWDVQTILSTAPTSRPVTSIYLGSFRSTCLALDSQQTLTWSKPSSPGYRSLTIITSTYSYWGFS